MKRGLRTASRPGSHAAKAASSHPKGPGVEEYPELIKASFRKLEENPVLFLPNGLAFLASLLLAVGLLHMTGILRVVMAVPVSLTNTYYLSSAIYALMTSDPTRFWGIVVLYLVVEFFVSLFFITAKYGMIKDVILTGKTSLARGLAFGRKHLFDVMGIYLASLLLILLPAGLLLLLGFAFLPVSRVGGIVAMGLFSVLALLYAAYVIYRLIFVYPVMTFEQEGPMKSLKDDFHYVKTHVGHTFITWIALLCIAVVYVILRSPVEVVRTIATNGYLVLTLTGIIIVLEVLVSTWEHIFIFKAYLAGRGRAKAARR